MSDEILLTVGDVCRRLRLSQRGVYRLRDAGRLPQSIKIGGSVRWRAADIEKWVIDGCPSCRPAKAVR